MQGKGKRMFELNISFLNLFCTEFYLIFVVGPQGPVGVPGSQGLEGNIGRPGRDAQYW